MGPDSSFGEMIGRFLGMLLLVSVSATLAGLWGLSNFKRPPERRRGWPFLIVAALVLQPLLALAFAQQGNALGIAAIVVYAAACVAVTRSAWRGIVAALLIPGIAAVIMARLVRVDPTPRFPAPDRLVPCVSPQAQFPPLPESGIVGPSGLHWSPAGRFLLSNELLFVLWGVSEQRGLGRFNAPFQRSTGSSRSGCIDAAGFSPDADFFFAWDATAVRVWSTADLRSSAELPLLRPDNVDTTQYPMALGPGGAELAYRDFADDRRIHILRAANDKPIDLPFPAGVLTYLADGRLLVCGTKPDWNKLSLIEGGAVTGKLIQLPGPCRRLEPSTGSTLLLDTGCNENLVDVDSGKITPLANLDDPRCPRSSPDLRFRLSFDKKTRRTTILDYNTGNPIPPRP